MIKENKDFFLYILGIIILTFMLLFLLDFLSPGSVSTDECGFLRFKCWFSDITYRDMTYDEASEMTIDTSKDYKAIIKTNYGDIEVDLFEKNAPVAVNNFVFLSEEGYYNDVRFHRVVNGFLVQTGDRNTLDSDPENDGNGGPGYTFEDEINWKSLDFSKAKIQQLKRLDYSSNEDVVSFHLEQRSVALASNKPDSNGSQFFIVTASSDDTAVKGLEGRHTVFARVISGWEIVEKIEQSEVDNPVSNSPRPLEDIIISGVEIQVN